MVVQLINDDSGETVYCHRIRGKSCTAPVYASGSYTLKAGKSTADTILAQKKF